MKVVKLSFLFLAVLAMFGCKSKGEKIAKPNVLVILADDFGYNDMSYRGSEFYETPNIDRIAQEGVDFTNGYANCQVCSPSRASILTGQFTARHGVTDWIGAPVGEAWRDTYRHSKLLPPNYEFNLPHEIVTLPEAMKEAGYKTFFAGKWHLGEKGSWPEDHGFDINIAGWDVGGPKGGYFAPYKNPNLKSGPDGENLSIRLANETVDFMKSHQDEPFFAYLSFYAVHGPIQTSEDKWSKYRAKAIKNGVADKGFEMGTYLPMRQTQDNPVYAGLVEQMDDAVGVVLQALETMGLDKNTVVVFTSDNGGVASGDAFSTSNAPLRAGKGHQYEGGIREPYFIKVPWLEAGVCNTPVMGSDIYPTILDLAGVDLKPDQHADGVSLLPLLKGDTTEKRSLIWHYPHYGNQGGDPVSIIRRDEWKLIRYYEEARFELFNLKDDISETHNLSEQYPEKVIALDKELTNYLISVEAGYPVVDTQYSSAKAAAHYGKMKAKKMPQLEKQRLDMLKEDYTPNKDWWGSMVTKD